MVKFKKILTKCLAAFLAFAILPCIFYALSIFDITVSAEQDAIPDRNYEILTKEWDDDIHSSITTDYLGERLKLSECRTIPVTACVRDETDSPEKNVYISFFIDDSNPHHLSLRYHKKLSEEERTVYICSKKDGESVLEEFAEDAYTQEWLTFCFENGSEDYNRFYAEGCVLGVTVDLRALAILESVETGSIFVRTCIAEDFFHLGNYRVRSSGIFYATDGEYVAFSDVSEEDAIAILTGELPGEDPPVEDPPADEPRGFWATLVDFFDGCD